MELLNDEDSPVVNILDFYRAHGIPDQTAFQIVLHMLLTRSYAIEADARAAASELGCNIPFIFPGSGTKH